MGPIRLHEVDDQD